MNSFHFREKISVCQLAGIALAATCLLFGDLTAFAQAPLDGPANLGNAVQGANRRVRSTIGFAAINGYFTEPDSYYVPGNNRYNSKPSFYLGLSGLGTDFGRANTYNVPVEVDAGIQREPARYGVMPGWTAFISYSHGPIVRRRRRRFTSPRVGGRPWRIARGRLGTVHLTCGVESNGAASLQVNARFGEDDHQSFTFFWNADGTDGGTNPQTVFSREIVNGVQRLSRANLRSMRVKRVVAITQQLGVNYDGSYMSAVDCRNFSIARGRFNNAGQYSWAWVQSPGWPRARVARTPNTGFAPPGRDRRGQWIVDFNFTDIGARDRAGRYRNNPLPARYHTWEAVGIYLRNPVPRRAVRGGPTRRGGT